MLKGLGGLGDMAKMMKAAQEMQGKMAEMQDEMHSILVTGESGAGLVKATCTAKGELTSLDIDPSIFSEDQKEVDGSRPRTRKVVVARDHGPADGFEETKALPVEEEVRRDARRHLLGLQLRRRFYLVRVHAFVKGGRFDRGRRRFYT